MQLPPHFILSAIVLFQLTACQTTPEKPAYISPPPVPSAGYPRVHSSPAASPAPSGWVTTASGLRYRVVMAGPAEGTPPTIYDTVTVHYHGTLVDGTVFDSSIRRGEPASFGVGQLIQGWTEALKMMRPGDKWELYIPSRLAYGSKGAGSVIPPDADLKFDVELLKVVKW